MLKLIRDGKFFATPPNQGGGSMSPALGSQQRLIALIVEETQCPLVDPEINRLAAPPSCLLEHSFLEPQLPH